jgi:ARP2/3 complex 16 kDa subunit (p16-Arc)
MASSFRKINVDQYDEEHTIPPNELIPENPLSDADLVGAVQSTAAQVRQFLQRGDTQSALAAVLIVEPYGTSPSLEKAKVIQSGLSQSTKGLMNEGTTYKQRH